MSYLEFFPILGVIEALGTIGTIAFYTSLAAGAAGSALSYQQSQTAAKQTELNAKAQQQAIDSENARKAQEQAENQRRLATQGRRERAAQLADIVGTGFMPNTGTPLALMADTIAAQSTRMADYSTEAGLEQSRLKSQGISILAEGRSSAAMQRSQAGASLISGLAGAATSGYGMYRNRAGTASPRGSVKVGGLSTY